MTKRLVSAAASVAAIGAAALALAPSAMAAPHGGVCQLSGTATFGTPLTVSSQPFTYTFSGTLSSCQSSSSTAPTGGTITTPAAATGSGGCVSSTTSGIAVVTWNTGTTTVEQYSTTGAAAAVALQGKVIASTTVGTTTYTTDEPSTPVGDSAGGLVTFNPTNGPTGCNTGVPSAAINGAVGTGGQ